MKKTGGYSKMNKDGQLKNMGYDKSKSTSQSAGNPIDMGGYAGSKGIVGGLKNPR